MFRAGMAPLRILHRGLDRVFLRRRVGNPAGVQAEALEARRLLAVPLGDEFHVNTYTTNGQAAPKLAMDPGGNFVIAWESAGQDGGIHSSVYAQRFNSAGAAQGSEFRVNTYTTNGQFSPSIAMDADGDFVLTWMSEGQDGSDVGIYAQRFNSAGTAQGTEFRVNTYTTGHQSSPVVAMDPGGNFVIAWFSDGQDGDDYGVYAQRYSAAGVAQGSEFLVNTYTTDAQRSPGIAMGTDGRFIITWRSLGQDGDNYGVYAQRYNSAGVPQGSEFLVNTYTTNIQRGGVVKMDAAGNFVVAWQSYGQDGDLNGVYAQRYNSAGVAQGSEFLVNTYTSTSQRGPSLAMDADGDFVITWESYYDQDGSKAGAYAQAFDSSGARVGTEFLVNTYTTEGQGRPSAAMDADGNLVIAWDSDDQEDGNFAGVYAQRFSEIGTLSGGTLTVRGTSGNDTITLAVQGADLVVTRNGTALSFTNADVTAIEVYALDGNDSVTIGAGVIGSYVLGGNGNDVLVGAQGNDALVGASGKDNLNGGGGDDRVAGGKHGDVVAGGDGNDRVYGDEGNDLLDGGAGRDRMYGGADNDTMLGGNQNDTMYGDAGSDSLHGGNHSDRLFPGPGPDSADGGAGDDNVFDADGSIDNLIGGAGVDGQDSDINDLISLFEFEV